MMSLHILTYRKQNDRASFEQYTGLVKIMLTLKLVGLVLQIVLQTFDGLRLENLTLPSSLQPLFFAPVLISHP
jgi:hypothetical protein